MRREIALGGEDRKKRRAEAVYRMRWQALLASGRRAP